MSDKDSPTTNSSPQNPIGRNSPSDDFNYSSNPPPWGHDIWRESPYLDIFTSVGGGVPPLPYSLPKFNFSPQTLEVLRRVYKEFSNEKFLNSDKLPNAPSPPPVEEKKPPAEAGTDLREDMRWAAWFHSQMAARIEAEHGKPVPRTPDDLSRPFKAEEGGRMMKITRLICGR